MCFSRFALSTGNDCLAAAARRQQAEPMPLQAAKVSKAKEKREEERGYSGSLQLQGEKGQRNRSGRTAGKTFLQ